ncbi:MAG: alkaline phosphatase [Flavobacteriales bacterium]|nr:alkaline phosphatase [Flavobacteriales bacterium]
MNSVKRIATSLRIEKSRIVNWLFLFVFFPFAVFAQAPAIKHVIVIGVDGMSPDGIQKAKTPILDSILKVAAYSWKCEAVLPTSSSPNWASMIMGAGPDKHGVTSNAWQPHKQTIELECEGTKGNGKPSGMWPTVFGELRRQKPDTKIACFNDWLAFNRLFEKGVVNRQRDAILLQAASHHGYKGITRMASNYFKWKKPDFMFVHLDHVDHAGHHDGHGTQAYYDAVSVADEMIGRIINAVKASGELEHTVILITADHGGIGHGHGGDTPEERFVPWILTGTGVVNGELQVPVKTYDTAATLAYLLGIKAPDCWVGRPVIAAIAQ